MKKHLILFLLLPVFCFADTNMTGVSNCGGAIIGYVPRILTVGDSTTVGIGATGDIGSYRRDIQKIIGQEFNFVGQWGNDNGTNTTSTPELATRDIDYNHRLKAEGFKPKHFGFSGQTIQGMVDAFNDLNQFKWLDVTKTDDFVIIHLGTNNSPFQFDMPDPCEIFPTPCTVARVVDTSNVESDVAYLLTLITSLSNNYPDTSIIICQILPREVPEENQNRSGYLNDWIIAFNIELGLEVVTLQETKSNLFLVDMYEPFIDGWVDQTYTEDFTHPNDAGYSLMAQIFLQILQ
ncbi:MAG: hypothetical protein KAS30_01465 [Candidatus Diapherotrites archaeon]|nr:hypothetical protein [Candidatus Diapherotrites archaeon]